MIVVVDYKTGNVGSILNMLKRIGAEVLVSSDPEQIMNATKLILPGVGSFDAGVKKLEEMGLKSVLEEKVIIGNTPILGICLGMQLFAKKSEEGILSGLGWISGEVRKLNFDNGLKIPHMGWNTVEIKKDDLLFNGTEKEQRYYFVHSYHFVCENIDNVLATTNYGGDFNSVIRKGNIIGVQFHPEKSHKFGMKLLKNFVEL